MATHCSIKTGTESKADRSGLLRRIAAGVILLGSVGLIVSGVLSDLPGGLRRGLMLALHVSAFAGFLYLLLGGDDRQ